MLHPNNSPHHTSITTLSIQPLILRFTLSVCYLHIMQVGIHVRNANRSHLLYQLLKMGTTCWGTVFRRILRLHSDSAERIPWLISSRISLGRGTCHFHSEEFVLAELHLCRLGRGLDPPCSIPSSWCSVVSVKQPFLFIHALWRLFTGIQWLVCNLLGKLPTELCCLLIFFSLPKDHKRF